MHFWIDKRSSGLHHYGGGRRGPGGPGGFYSQNFGTHRISHLPPSSLGHHNPHPHRIRSRSSSTTNATTSASSNSSNNATNNNFNNNAHSLSTTASSNNNHQPLSSSSGVITVINTNSASTPANIALQQYPHQQPHQGQHALIGPAVYGNAAMMGGSSNLVPGSGTRISGRHTDQTGRNITYYGHPPQQQQIVGGSGGIVAISGSSTGTVNSATAANHPMSFVTGDDGDIVNSSTLLTFPHTTGPVAVNTSNSINVQLISCVNINPDNRGLDLSWRNPYHVPGSSISRCRAYARDAPPSVMGSSSAGSSRGTRGRRTSSSSSSGLGRSSIGTVPGTTGPSLSNHSQNATNETPEGMTDRSTRSERTSFDHDTVTPQRSLSLTTPEGAEQSSAGTSTGGRPSIENDPGWACTKRIGLTLCFLAFILMCTVGAKFLIQGPVVIDSSRAGKAEAAAYFLFTELIFVAFAMALFFTGVACLRTRTNAYLLRQFNQYIMSSSSTTAVPGGAMNGMQPRHDAYDFEYYDETNPPPGGLGSPTRGHHHHLHHSLHHGGFHHYRHHRSDGSLLEGEFGSGGDLSQSFHGAGPIHYPPHNSSSSSRHGRSKPPPYHIALYLPLPEGMDEQRTVYHSPTDENNPNSANNMDQDGKPNKTDGSGDGIGFIDSSSIKDAQDAAGGNNVNYSGTNYTSNDDRNSSSRNGRGEETTNHDNRSETPPPPYEQL